MKILLSKAHEYVTPSRSAIYEDARTGKLSTEKDPTRGNKKVVDLAELQSVYDTVRHPEENPNRTELDALGRDEITEKLVETLESQIQDLKAQLDTATTEKTKLLDMLAVEQEKNRVLQLPPAKDNWFYRLIGIRAS